MTVLSKQLINSSKHPTLSIPLFFFLVGLCPSALAAQLSPTMTLDTEVRLQGVDTRNADLGTSGSDNAATGAAEVKFKFTNNFNENALFYWEGRAVGNAGRGGVQDEDTGRVSGDDSFLEWRQSYFEFSNIAGQTPLSARIGRQRVKENYGIWWNEDFDALRMTYDTTLFKGTLTGGENLFSYRTDDEDSRNERDIARIMAEGSWQYHYQQFFEARFAYANDHSSLYIGQPQNPNDIDNTTGNLYWAGVRAAGQANVFDSPDEQKLLYRVDLMRVSGDEDVGTIGGGNTIIAINDQDVSGWAFDASTDIPLPHAKPLIHLGYAYGSGDSDAADDTDHSFRQTGMEGNFSRIGALTQNTNNYGTVLRPELGNIHILSAGVTSPVLAASDAGLIYRRYRLSDPATSISSSGVFNTLDGAHRDLGQGVDLLFNMDVLKETATTLAHVQSLELRSSLGFFRSGDAYGAAKGENAVRGLVELKAAF
jgi:alginate production protein